MIKKNYCLINFTWHFCNKKSCKNQITKNFIRVFILLRRYLWITVEIFCKINCLIRVWFIVKCVSFYFYKNKGDFLVDSSAFGCLLPIKYVYLPTLIILFVLCNRIPIFQLYCFLVTSWKLPSNFLPVRRMW